MESNYTVGLDIGSNKIVVLIGERLDSGAVNIVGIGEAESSGVEKGLVTDLNCVVDSIKAALTDAEKMADCIVSSVNLSISGSHIKSFNESGTWAIEDEEVTVSDVVNVIHNASSVKIQDNQRLLHVIPQEYSLDTQDRIKDPVGLSGVKLRSAVHLITCHNDLVKNIEKAVERCGLKIDQHVFSGVASSVATLSPDEKELGVCILDIGGGTMDICVYIAGALQYSKVLDYAGNSVTNDISIAFSAPPKSAENVKIEYGSLIRDNINVDETIKLPNVGGRPASTLKRHILVDVIEPRYTELLTLVKNELFKFDTSLEVEGLKQQLAAGLVITGGGAQIKGLVNIASKIFDKMPVRIGVPENVSGLAEYINSPAYSTALGLLRYKNEEFIEEPELNDNWFSTLVKKVKIWIKKEY